MKTEIVFHFDSWLEMKKEKIKTQQIVLLWKNQMHFMSLLIYLMKIHVLFLKGVKFVSGTVLTRKQMPLQVI